MQEIAPSESAESFDAEKSLLLNIQQENAKTLENLGITDKARAVLLERRAEVANGRSFTDPNATLNNLTSVCVAWYDDIHANNYNAPAVRFSTPRVDAQGYQSVHQWFAPLTIKEEDAVRTHYLFNDDDVEVVIGMLRGLEEARDTGLLPHLKKDAATIDYPYDILPS